MLEVQPAFASRFRQGLDAAMVDEGATIEDDVGDAGFLGTLGDELANRRSSFLVGAGLQRLAQVQVERRGGSKRAAGDVVDDLRIDVLRRTVNRETRTSVGDLLQRAADARSAKPEGFFLSSHPTSSCLPCGRSFRQRTSRPCPCRARDRGTRGFRRQPGRRAACRYR